MNEELGGSAAAGRPVLEASAASAGMLIFALSLRLPAPWFLFAPAGFILTIAALWFSFRSGESPRNQLGFTELSRPVYVWTVAGILLGAGLAILFRFLSDQSLLPRGAERFIFVAAAVGAVEEMLYRGYIQGQFRALGWLAAVMLAAVAHTVYKTALFAFPPEGIQIDLGSLAFWTLIGGSAFGLTRHFSGSVLPPLVAHVLFDILVYGDRAYPPWWVWG